ncbi:MAG: TGS domain-containing protein, partial [Leadbetterella sp.]|nr:TGS domain-containing protein [Leadbetterella sp.]
MMISVTLPDGSKREYQNGATPMDVALSISEGLARNVLAAKVDGQVVDLNTPLEKSVDLQLLTWNDTEGKSTFWHSSAHLMAEALESLYPGVKFWVGPPVENGFYYDIDTGEKSISSDDFKKIEDKMLELARQKNEFKRIPITKTDALKYFGDKGDEYKLDLLSGLEDGNITLYQQGNFTDLCRGPHIPNTGFIKAAKIMNAAAAYFKGDQNNKMLTRIYGVTFPKAKELEEYLTLLEEAKRRDHRKLGAELEFFTFSEKVGKGLPLWLPKGAMLRE